MICPRYSQLPPRDAAITPFPPPPPPPLPPPPPPPPRQAKLLTAVQGDAPATIVQKRFRVELAEPQDRWGVRELQVYHDMACSPDGSLAKSFGIGVRDRARLCRHVVSAAYATRASILSLASARISNLQSLAICRCCRRCAAAARLLLRLL
jgi:hypothetical protein